MSRLPRTTTMPKSGVARCHLLTRVRQIASIYPTSTALVTEASAVSYAQILTAIDSWTNRYRSLNLPRGSVVIIVSPIDQELPSAFLGARAASLVPVMVDGIDPTAALELLHRVCQPGATVDTVSGEVTPGARRPLPVPEDVGYLSLSSDRDGTRVVLGQTQGLLRYLDWEAKHLAWRPGQDVGFLTSPSLDAALRDMFLPLSNGGRLNLCPPEVRTRPERVADWLRNRGVQVMHANPSLSRRWLEHHPGPTPHLTSTLFAGEDLHSSDVEAWRCFAPNSRIINLYGPPETTQAKFFYDVPKKVTPGVQPVGGPLPDTGLSLIPGVQGNVTISSTDGALGYLPKSVTKGESRRLQRENGLTLFHTRGQGHLDEHSNLVITTAQSDCPRGTAEVSPIPRLTTLRGPHLEFVRHT